MHVQLSQLGFMTTLRGTWNQQGDTYKLKWNPNAPTLQILAKVSSEGRKYSVLPSNIEYVGMEGIPSQALAKTLYRSKERFEIKVEQNPLECFKVRICLKPSPLDMPMLKERVRSSSEQLPTGLLSLRNAHDLACLWRDKREDPLVENLLRGMVEYFISLPVLDRSKVNEIIEIFECLANRYQKEVIRKLIDQEITSASVPPGLTEILSRFQKVNSHLTLKRIREEFSIIPKSSKYLKPLTSPDCIDLMNSLVYKLEQSNVDDYRKAFYLHALIIFLDMMLTIEHKDMTSDKYYKIFYQSIKRCSNSSNSKVTFLVAYGVESLGFNEQHELKKCVILRQTLQLFRDKLKEQKEEERIIEPWFTLGKVKIQQSPNSIIQNEEIEWLVYLIFFQQIYLTGHSRSLVDFKDLKDCIRSSQKEDQEKVKQKIPVSQKRLFVQGFIELLRSIIDVSASESLEMAINAVLILGKIGCDNQAVQAASGSYLFRVTSSKNQDQHQKFIAQEILKILEHYALLPHAKITEAAQNCIRDLQSSPPSIASSCQSNEVFEQSLQTYAPWIQGMRKLKEELERDDNYKIISENENNFDFKCKLLNSDNSEFSVKNKLSEFIEDSKNKVIVLAGGSGIEKTKFLKKFVLTHLNSYQSSHPIPFFIDLISLANPQRDLINETLSRYQLIGHKTYLQQHRTLWILDGFHEHLRGQKMYNFYQTNEMSRWPNAQFILSCQKVTPQEFIYFDPHSRIRSMDKERVMESKILEIES